MKSYDNPRLANNIFFQILRLKEARFPILTMSLFFRPIVRLDRVAQNGLPNGATLAAKFKLPWIDMILSALATFVVSSSSLRLTYLFTLDSADLILLDLES